MRIPSHVKAVSMSSRPTAANYKGVTTYRIFHQIKGVLRDAASGPIEMTTFEGACEFANLHAQASNAAGALNLLTCTQSELRFYHLDQYSIVDSHGMHRPANC